jgi:DNA-binding SARP family transcriptional activator
MTWPWACDKECDLWVLRNTRGKPDEDAEFLLGLYSVLSYGPPLATEPFQQWTAIQRSRLENQLETSILNATGENPSPADMERSVRLLAKLVELCPMCFQALWRLMELSATNGDPSTAVRYYEHFARRLKLEFNEAPPPELSDFYIRSRPHPGRASRPMH